MKNNILDLIGVSTFITGLMVVLVNLTDPSFLILGLLILLLGAKLSTY